MKAIVIFIFNLAIVQMVFAQCDETPIDTVLQFANVTVPTDMIHLMSSQTKGGLTMPIKKGRPYSVIKSMGYWISALDIAGNIHSSITIDFPEARKDFYSGPIDFFPFNDKGICTVMNKIYTVTKKEMIAHLKSLDDKFYNDKPYLQSDLPDGIKKWPARGNPYISESRYTIWPNYGARFHDENGDGLYHPLEGDYPFLEQFYCYGATKKFPDYLYFWIINDNESPIRFSTGTPVNIQLNNYLMSYENNQSLADGLYFRTEIINKSEMDFYIYPGLFINPDLGCKLNDKFAFDSIGQNIIIYNGSKDERKNFDCADDDQAANYPYSIAINLRDIRGTVRSFLRNDNGTFALDAIGNKIVINDFYAKKFDTLVYDKINAFQIINQSILNNPKKLNQSGIVKTLLSGKKLTGEPYYYNDKIITKQFTGNPIDPEKWSMMTDSSYANQDLACLAAYEPFYMRVADVYAIEGSIHLIPLNKEVPDFHTIRQSVFESNQVGAHQCCESVFLGMPCHNIHFEPIENSDGVKLIFEELKSIENFTFGSMDENILPENPSATTANYKFEGYKVFQSKGGLGYAEDDFENMALVMQCDLVNNINDLYNYDADTFANDENKINRRWRRKLAASGKNKGLQYEMIVDKDLFAPLHDNALIEGSTYYYTIKPYYANQWREPDYITGYGQKTEYISPPGCLYSYTHERVSSQKPLKYYIDNGILYVTLLNKGDRITLHNTNGQFLHEFLSGESNGTFSLNIETYPHLFILHHYQAESDKHRAYKILNIH